MASEERFFEQNERIMFSNGQQFIVEVFNKNIKYCLRMVGVKMGRIRAEMEGLVSPHTMSEPLYMLLQIRI